MRIGCFKLLAALYPVLSMLGCAPVSTTDEEGRIIEHHFGYVRIIKPPRSNVNDAFVVQETETYGLKIQNGFTLGYEHDGLISIPLDCRMVAVVETKEQLDHLIGALTQLEGEKLCATVSPD